MPRKTASDEELSIPIEFGQPHRCPVCGAGVRPSATPGEPPCPACGHLLWYTSEEVGGVAVVHLSDNRVAVNELLDLLDHALLDGAVERLLLDFGGIQQVSSAALGKLVKLLGHSRQVRGALRLCNLHPDIRQVFRITRVDQVFAIHDTTDEALAAFAAGDP